MSLQSRLVNFISHPRYTPSNFDQLVAKLYLTPEEILEAKETLEKLVQEGFLAITKGDRYVLSKDADLFSGIIKFKTNGSAYIIPDHPPGTPEPASLSILARDTDVALHGDHVLVRLVKDRPKGRYIEGKRLPPIVPEESFAKVRKVLKRATTQVVGTLKKTSTYFFVLPDNPKITQDVIVADPSLSKLKPQPQIGDKVVVKLNDWIHPHLSPEGVITLTLGPTHTPRVEYEGILHKFDLNPEFDEAVLREVSSIPQEVQESEQIKREDCRNLFTFTIDPDDAQDFDDALSLEELADGDLRIGIHIADVSHYIHRDSIIDKEAQKRGNSTYLVGSVIPMLPKAISNGICSLVEREDRLTKTVFVTFSQKGVIKKTYFSNSIIRSNKRLTYHQAFAFLKEDDIEKIAALPVPPAHQTGATGRSLQELTREELRQLQSSIRKLWNIASKLRNDRMVKGSLDFDIPEVKIFVDKEGAADRMEIIQYDESHQLIEEFMLLANQIVAKNLLEANLPFISRVHDKPDTPKLNELRETLLTFDINTGDLTNRKNVVKLLKKIKEHPQGYMLKIQFLKSLKQACYRAKSDGHYGLYMEHYTHFTSPIRRYADLIVHRIFDNYLIKHGYETAITRPHKVYRQGELESLAQHVSITEQNSTEAERESVKIKLLEFFERELDKKEKTIWKAMITDVRNHGIFVELSESMAFGLVPLSSLKDDIYFLDERGTTIIGRKTKKTFKIGDTIDVIVTKVDRFKRQIDFTVPNQKVNPANRSNKKDFKTTQDLKAGHKKRFDRKRGSKREK